MRPEKIRAPTNPIFSSNSSDTVIAKGKLAFCHRNDPFSDGKFDHARRASGLFPAPFGRLPDRRHAKSMIGSWWRHGDAQRGIIGACWQKTSISENGL
jgi:hypothetical protein